MISNGETTAIPHSLLLKANAQQETKAKSENKRIHYYTRARINFVVTLIMTIMILVLLVVPIWILYHLTTTLNPNTANVDCIGILLVATLIFSAVLCMFTKAKRHEVLAASAG